MSVNRVTTAWKIDDVVEVVNLTTHDIRVRLHGQEQVFPPSGRVCQVIVGGPGRRVPPVDGSLRGIPILECPSTFGEIVGLPPMVPGTAYLVSKKVIDNLDRFGPYRPDVFAPATNRAHKPILSGNEIYAVTALVGTRKSKGTGYDS